MYQYDDFDQAFVDQRVAHYRTQTQRYLDGRLSETEFLPLRLRNGLYVQRLAPMLRVAIPYGTLSAEQLRMLAHIARHYDKGYGHFSTRQNIQYNWPRLEEVPDILADLATVQMHAIQTSGNCIRNVSTDQFAGVAADEVVDARPYCELIRQWSTNHPEFDWLPRKFKIAVNGAQSDRAAIAVHDIGINMSRDERGQIRAEVLVGGGLGRTPVIGASIRSDLPVEDLLSYLQAIMRVYNRFGRRDNKYKARIKILVRALGADGFKAQVDEEFDHLVGGGATLTSAEIERIVAQFQPPQYAALDARSQDMEAARLASKDFSKWLDHNVHAHKQPGYASVVVSLKEPGIAPGDASDQQMDLVADLADRFGFGEIRVSHEQNLILPDIRKDDLFALWEILADARMAQPTAGTLTDVICCPGGDYCSLANAKSIPVAEELLQTFDDLDYLYDLGPIDLNISGCMNACGHHHVGHIGILGVDKKGDEFYQVSLGGSSGEDGKPAIGKILGPSFKRDGIVEVIKKIVDTYVSLRQDEESFLNCVTRLGLDPFKERVYGN